MRIRNFISIILLSIFTMPVQAITTGDEVIPGDKEITEVVEKELMLQPDVASHLIDVSTDDGIVMLSGTVDNLLAKERATEIAMAVKGVKGVVNKVKVQADKRPDEEITNDVKNALLADPATDAYELTVSTNNGIVSLSGKVNSWTERMLSEDVAKGVKGVTDINNNVAITGVSERRDDEIAADVKQLLRNDVRVDDGLIDVKVKNGKVMLSGTVGSAAEKNQAILDAWVAGVTAVEAKKLDVQPWARDEDMRKNK